MREKVEAPDALCAADHPCLRRRPLLCAPVGTAISTISRPPLVRDAG